jgi:hypothetical protein
MKTEYKPKPTDKVHVYTIVAGVRKVKVNRVIEYRRLIKVQKYLAKRYKLTLNQIMCRWESDKVVKQFKPAKKQKINLVKKWK